MGCQSSKGEHAKTEKSKLSKNDTNEKANVVGQPLADKSWQERQHNEIPLEKVTFSSEEMNDEMGRSVSELPINHNTDLKMRIPGSLILEPNEEITSNWKQSKKIKIHKHRSEQNLDNNKSYKQLGEKLNKKCGPNNGKRNEAEQIRKMIHYMKYLLKCRNSIWYHLDRKIALRNNHVLSNNNILVYVSH